MLSVVCWKWQSAPGYRSRFEAEHVNTLRRMVQRYYPSPHRFLFVTDDPRGLDPEVEVVPLWKDLASVPSPHGGHNPSCYRRLKAFSPEMASVLGERFVSVDLDTVVTGDLRPLWDRPEDFVIWGETDKRSWYNGSMWMMTAGARKQVWEQFNPKTSPQIAKKEIPKSDVLKQICPDILVESINFSASVSGKTVILTVTGDIYNDSPVHSWVCPTEAGKAAR